MQIDNHKAHGQQVRVSGTLKDFFERQNARNRLVAAEQGRYAEIEVLNQAVASTEAARRAEIEGLQQSLASAEGRARIKIEGLQGRLTLMEGPACTEIESLKQALASTQETLASKELKVSIANTDIMKAKLERYERRLSDAEAKYAELDATYSRHLLDCQNASKHRAQERREHGRQLRRLHGRVRNKMSDLSDRVRQLDHGQETRVQVLERRVDRFKKRGQVLPPYLPATWCGVLIMRRQEMEEALGLGGMRCKKCNPIVVSLLDEGDGMEVEGVVVKGEEGEEGEVEAMEMT